MTRPLRTSPLKGPITAAASVGAAGSPGPRRAVNIPTPAWLCVLAAAFLTAAGVYAIDVAEALRPLSGFDLTAIAWKQVVFAIIGLLAATVVATPHVRVVGVVAWPLMVVLVGLLVFLLAPFAPASLVTPRNGARAWIDLGPVDFQPSELAKVAYVLVIARYLRGRSTHRRIGGLIVPAIITAVPVGLITLQPDLGTASLFIPSLFAMLVAAGARLRHLTLIVLCATLAAPAAYPLLRDHQRARIVGILQQYRGDTSSQQDINYQSSTAQTLIGAGGLGGLGEAEARAVVRYNRLPERHNDMIFAVIVARFGLAGGAAVLAAYAVWILGAVMTSGRCRDPEAKLIGVGLSGFVAAQVLVNVGMNVGLLPIVGVTLPFVSYGGSSLITTWLMTGLVLSSGLHRSRPPYRAAFEYADGDEPSSNTSGSAHGRAPIGWRPTPI